MRFLLVFLLLTFIVLRATAHSHHRKHKYIILNDIHQKPPTETIPGKPFGDYRDDAPALQVKSGFKYISNVVPDAEAILFFGDMVDHKTPNKGSTFDPQLYDRLFTIVVDLAASFVKYFPEKPILTVVGNNDMPFKYQVPTVELKKEYYARLWEVWFERVPANRALRTEANKKTVLDGYYYFYDATPELRFIVINSLYWLEKNKLTNDPETATRQMKWVEAQLHKVAKQGRKAVIVTHVPPDVDFAGELYVQFRAEYAEQFDRMMYEYRHTIQSMMVGHIHLSYQQVKVKRHTPMPSDKKLDPYDNFVVSGFHKVQGASPKEYTLYRTTIATRAYSPEEATSPGFSIATFDKWGELKKLAEHVFDLKAAYGANPEEGPKFWRYFGSSHRTLGLQKVTGKELVKMHKKLLKDVGFLCYYLTYSTGFDLTLDGLLRAIAIYKEERYMTDQAFRVLEPCLTEEGFRKCIKGRHVKNR